LIKYILNHNK